MSLNPNQRPSIENILAHPFVQGETATKEQVHAEFKTRKEAVDKEVEKDAEERRTERAKHAKNREISRGNEEKKELYELFERLGLSDKEEEDEEKSRTMDEYDAEVMQKTT